MTMVMFLLLPELTQVWDTWGCPMCWERRAFSFADRALCPLCSGDVPCRQNLNDVPLALEQRPDDVIARERRRALELHYQRENNRSYFKWVTFPSKYGVYKSRHMNK